MKKEWPTCSPNNDNNKTNEIRSLAANFQKKNSMFFCQNIAMEWITNENLEQIDNRLL